MRGNAIADKMLKKISVSKVGINKRIVIVVAMNAPINVIFRLFFKNLGELIMNNVIIPINANRVFSQPTIVSFWTYVNSSTLEAIWVMLWKKPKARRDNKMTLYSFQICL